MTRRAKKPAATVPWIVMVPFAVSGVIHLVRPGVFTPIIPRPLRRWNRPLVVASGVAELACAVGLAVPSTRAAAGRASALVLAGVWPANVQMSVDLGRRAARRRTPKSWAAFAVSLARLPLQVTLIRRALGSSR
ncbi:hypothetical protein OR221_2433 [Microbacterium laevaniformans OR221]|nr:hypothetical protein OR221_2433 [Microbacterium laevaniformans OR221]